MKRLALLGIGVAFLAGCQDSKVLTAPAGDEILLDLSDGTLPPDEGNQDFFFLPPLMPDPSGNSNFEVSQFNPDLLPVAKICEIIGNPGKRVDSMHVRAQARVDEERTDREVLVVTSGQLPRIHGV